MNPAVVRAQAARQRSGVPRVQQEMRKGNIMLQRRVQCAAAVARQAAGEQAGSAAGARGRAAMQNPAGTRGGKAARAQSNQQRGGRGAQQAW